MRYPGKNIDALPRAGLIRSLWLLAALGGPLLAKGIIIRRPGIVALLQRTGIELYGVRLLQRLRARYGSGPLLLRIPFRQVAILLSAGDLRRVLLETPDPFSPDNREKHATLAHFEPEGSLISRGEARTIRRAFNEDVLESECPRHHLHARFDAVVEDEVAGFAPASAALAWRPFQDMWFRVIRRLFFGDAARDDLSLTALSMKLRRRANWAMFGPIDRRTRRRFLQRLEIYLGRPAAGSLAALAKEYGGKAEPAHQISQWLFAADAAAIAVYRAMAMLALHPDAIARARAERESERPYLRACILESVRLWPTTPAILRETCRPTLWSGRRMDAGTAVLIHAPYFHRDDQRLASAHCFRPEQWLGEEVDHLPFVPFSDGPGICPGKNLVLDVGSGVIARLLRGGGYRLPEGHGLDIERLPMTFDHFSLRLIGGSVRQHGVAVRG